MSDFYSNFTELVFCRDTRDTQIGQRLLHLTRLPLMRRSASYASPTPPLCHLSCLIKSCLETCLVAHLSIVASRTLEQRPPPTAHYCHTQLVIPHFKGVERTHHPSSCLLILPVRVPDPFPSPFGRPSGESFNEGKATAVFANIITPRKWMSFWRSRRIWLTPPVDRQSDKGITINGGTLRHSGRNTH